jgi:hypothetical protein
MLNPASQAQGTVKISLIFIFRACEFRISNNKITILSQGGGGVEGNKQEKFVNRMMALPKGER